MSTSEVTIYQNDGVLITSTRAVLGAKTYAMSNITSVTSVIVPANKTLSILIATFGALMMLCCGCYGFYNFFIGIAGDSTQYAIGSLLAVAIPIILGVLVLAGGIALYTRTKPDYAVVIGSSSGEIKALMSKDKEHIMAIVNAMNDAIIRRG